MAGQAPYYMGLGYKDPNWSKRYNQWVATEAMYGNSFGNAPPKIGEKDKDNDYMKYLLENKMYHAYSALRMPGNTFWKQVGYGLYGNAGKGKYVTKGKKLGGHQRYRREAEEDDDNDDHDHHKGYGYGINPMSYLNTLALKGPMGPFFGKFPWYGSKFPMFGGYPSFGFPHLTPKFLGPFFGGFPYGGNFGGHFGGRFGSHFGGHYGGNYGGHYGGNHGYGKRMYRKKRSLYGGHGYRYPWYNFPWTGKMFYSPHLNYNAYNMANLLKWSTGGKY